MMKKAKSQVKAYFFDRSSPISVIRFLATFKLACITNNINERAALRVLLFIIKNALATILDRRCPPLLTSLQLTPQ